MRIGILIKLVGISLGHIYFHLPNQFKAASRMVKIYAEFANIHNEPNDLFRK